MTGWRWIAGMLLGAGLVLHGLANAVLPLRGVDVAASGVWMPAMTALYVTAIVGFVAAGLGLLGVRPLGRVVIPAAWVAGLSPAAHLRDPAPDLWQASCSAPRCRDARSCVLPDTGRSRNRQPWGRETLSARPRFSRGSESPRGRAVHARGAQRTGMAAGASRRSHGDAVVEMMHGSRSMRRRPPYGRGCAARTDRAGFTATMAERPLWRRRPNVPRSGPSGSRGGWASRVRHQRLLGGRLASVKAGDRRAGADRALVLRNWGAFVLGPRHGGTRLLIRSTSGRAHPGVGAALNFTAFECRFIMQRGSWDQSPGGAKRHDAY